MNSKSVRYQMAATSQGRSILLFNPFDLCREFLSILNPFRKNTYSIDEGNPWPPFLWSDMQNTDSKHEQFSKEQGELILALYFFQLFNRRQICVDLRPGYFNFVKGRPFWTPSSLTFRFSEKFLHGIQNIYNGLFSEDCQLSKTAMVDIGLIPERLNETERDAIFSVFQDHFSQAHEKPIAFTLGYFFKSFSRCLKLLFKYRVKLPAEFAVFGCYLFSLYLTLRRCPHELDVASAFKMGMNNEYSEGKPESKYDDSFNRTK